jgi:probable F420-dependent oxidoreductase
MTRHERTMMSPTAAWGVGLHYGGTAGSMGLVDLARAAEERGFDSIVVSEHTHIPVSRVSRYPEGDGTYGPLPAHHSQLWDPLVGLAFVAANTGLVIGTCVTLVGEHDPIAYAKAVATLDVLSGGRLVLGVGFGWNVEEFEDHGFPATVRRRVVLEKIEVMKRLWTDEVASFAGEYIKLSPSWAEPKPLQRPYPPLLFGGMPGDATFRRVASLADGWIPLDSPGLHDDVAKLRGVWEEAGRDPESLHLMVMQRLCPASVLRPLVEGYRAMGVKRVVIRLPTAGADEILPLLDDLTALVP